MQPCKACSHSMRAHEVTHCCRACWDPFVDPVTSIVSYSVTAHQYPGNVTPLVPPLNVGLQRSAQIVNLTLTVSPRCDLRSGTFGTR